MEYIIMAGGKGVRWHNYNNTSKHLVEIGSENILQRIVRQLHENKQDDISITSDDPLYQIEGTKINRLIYDNKVYNMFYYGSLDHEITFLYGDTYYSDNTIKQIINTKTDDILFFGSNDSIVAIKVVNVDKFKKYVEEMKDYEQGRVGWAIYRKINNLEENIPCDNFIKVEDKDIVNVNEPKDYDLLINLIKNNN